VRRERRRRQAGRAGEMVPHGIARLGIAGRNNYVVIEEYQYDRMALELCPFWLCSVAEYFEVGLFQEN
jgi:hypothetical protein